jgi:hypothetical protein
MVPSILRFDLQNPRQYAKELNEARKDTRIIPILALPPTLIQIGRRMKFSPPHKHHWHIPFHPPYPATITTAALVLSICSLPTKHWAHSSLNHSPPIIPSCTPSYPRYYLPNIQLFVVPTPSFFLKMGFGVTCWVRGGPERIRRMSRWTGHSALRVMQHHSMYITQGTKQG